MQGVFEFVFGKANRENKFLLGAYWFLVCLFFIALIFSIILFEHWISILLFAVLYIIVFRAVYVINSWILQKVSMKVLFIVGGIASFVFISFVGVMLLFSDNFNMAINATKTTGEDGVELSIGQLRGDYHVVEFDVYEDGRMLIPYEASVGEGDISLFVEREGEKVWEENVSVSSQGNIEFLAEAGTYDIQITTEEADQVLIELGNRYYAPE